MYKLLSLIAILSALSPCQEKIEKMTLEKKNPFGIERPPSKPTGEAYDIKLAITENSSQRFKLTTAFTMQTPMGEQKQFTAMESELKFLKQDKDKKWNYRISYKLTDFKSGNVSMETLIKEVKVGKFFGKTNERGAFIPSTIKKPKKNDPVKAQIINQVTGLFPSLPEKPVKVGETWDVSGEKLAKRFANTAISVKGLTGKAYQVFLKTEKMEGQLCAKIQTVYSIKIDTDDVSGGKGFAIPGYVLLKGDRTDWISLAGKIIKAVSNNKMDIGMKIPGRGEMKMKGTGKVTVDRLQAKQQPVKEK